MSCISYFQQFVLISNRIFRTVSEKMIPRFSSYKKACASLLLKLQTSYFHHTIPYLFSMGRYNLVFCNISIPMLCTYQCYNSPPPPPPPPYGAGWKYQGFDIFYICPHINLSNPLISHHTGDRGTGLTLIGALWGPIPHVVQNHHIFEFKSLQIQCILSCFAC